MRCWPISLILILGCSGGTDVALMDTGAADTGQTTDPGRQRPDYGPDLGKTGDADESDAPGQQDLIPPEDCLFCSDVELDAVRDEGEPDIWEPEPCEMGEQGCRGDHILQCIGGFWSLVQPACTNGCYDGACTLCRAGSTKCESSMLQVCSATGASWQVLLSCDFGCNEDTDDCCQPDCTHKACGDDGCGDSCGECDDELDCTEDQCNALGQCEHSITEGNCLISGSCAADGYILPSNPCRLCDVTQTQTDWTTVCWRDASSGLTWALMPSEPMVWSTAVKYCQDLELAGGGWRLPSFPQLRSLVRGCPQTMLGGACRVDFGCFASSCRTLGSGIDCDGCPPGEGPAEGGCYWPTPLAGECGFYWSTTDVSDEPNDSWGIWFGTSDVYELWKESKRLARCMR